MDTAAPAVARAGGDHAGAPPLRTPIAEDRRRRAPAPAPAGRRLRWHLLTFAAALLLPVLAFAVGVALEYGAAQRTWLEGEARTVARELEAEVDRELAALLAAAQTLATSPTLEARDFPAFERQAYEVAAGLDLDVVLLAPSGRHIVNTAVPRGSRIAGRVEFAHDPAAEDATAAGLPFVSGLFKDPLTDRTRAKPLA